jgi:hypothetical protein
LFAEIAVGDRVRRTPVAFDGHRVLLVSADAEPRGHVFRRNSHVHRVERIGERTDHHVDGRAVAHALTPAFALQQISAAAHRFGASGDRDIGVAEQNRLRSRHDRLESAPA